MQRKRTWRQGWWNSCCNEGSSGRSCDYKKALQELGAMLYANVKIILKISITQGKLPLQLLKRQI